MQRISIFEHRCFFIVLPEYDVENALSFLWLGVTEKSTEQAISSNRLIWSGHMLGVPPDRLLRDALLYSRQLVANRDVHLVSPRREGMVRNLKNSNVPTRSSQATVLWSMRSFESNGWKLEGVWIWTKISGVLAIKTTQLSHYPSTFRYFFLCCYWMQLRCSNQTQSHSCKASG